MYLIAVPTKRMKSNLGSAGAEENWLFGPFFVLQTFLSSVLYRFSCYCKKYLRTQFKGRDMLWLMTAEVSLIVHWFYCFRSKVRQSSMGGHRYWCKALCAPHVSQKAEAQMDQRHYILQRFISSDQLPSARPPHNVRITPIQRLHIITLSVG